MKKLMITMMAGCFILAGAATSTAGNNFVPPFGLQQITLANGISYLSGGVADMANSGLAHLNLDNEAYNLKIIYNFESGNYLSLINVKIQNTKGKVLLDTVVKGPWFFVRLPAGRYQVTTYFNRQYEIRNITVGKPPQTVIENWTL